LPWFENKKKNDSESYFLSIQILEMQKRIHLEEMKQKQGEAETKPRQKGSESQLEYKSHIHIDKDYELIRRFKTTTKSLHHSQIDLI
jgi:IS5 family transposase